MLSDIYVVSLAFLLITEKYAIEFYGPKLALQNAH